MPWMVNLQSGEGDAPAAQRKERGQPPRDGKLLCRRLRIGFVKPIQAHALLCGKSAYIGQIHDKPFGIAFDARCMV